MPKKTKTKKVRIHSSGGGIDEAAVGRTTSSLSAWGGQSPSPGPGSGKTDLPAPPTPAPAPAPTPAPAPVTTAASPVVPASPSPQPQPQVAEEVPAILMEPSRSMRAGSVAHSAMKRAVKEMRLEGLNGEEFLTESMLEDQMVHAVAKNFPIFSLGRDGVSRAVVNFIHQPPPHPLTLCFQFPSTALNHRYILALCKTVLQPDPLSHVVSIQYVDRNVRHGARGMENRWLITINRDEGCLRLLEAGFHIFNKNIELRRYDDVLAEEYKEFTDYIAAQTRMYVNEKMSTLKNRKFALPSIPKEDGEERGEEGEEGPRFMTRRGSMAAIPSDEGREGGQDSKENGDQKMGVLEEVTEEEEGKAEN